MFATALSFARWFFLGTKAGRIVGVGAIAMLGFWWFVDEVGDRREQKVAPAIVKKVEKQITKRNTEAGNAASKGAGAVHRCADGGGVWDLAKGSCRKR